MDLDDDDDDRASPAATSTSFVKRSRPRGAGIRARGGLEASTSTAAESSQGSSSGAAAAPSASDRTRRRVAAISLNDDDDDDDETRLSAGGPSRTATPPVYGDKAVPLNGGDKDAEDHAAPAESSVVFRSRNRNAQRMGASATTSTGRRSKPVSFSAFDGDADGAESEEPGFEIRRSKLASQGKEARKKEREGKGARQSLAAPNSLAAPSLGGAGDDSNGVSAQPSYSSSYLAELKASTPSLSRRPTGGSTGNEVQDPMATQLEASVGDDAADEDGHSLARSKFASDYAHDGIPSESVIRAAKEKRARMRKEALENGQAGGGEDFISLGVGASSSSSSSRALRPFSAKVADDYQGPHPESRLQREEDEYGDGEEEYAEYTGATERIPIGKKAEKEYKAQQRREMEEALADGRNDYLGSSTALAEDEEMDEDEQEWERAQLQRTAQMPGQQQKQERRKRAKSPYRPAEIPLTAPLPSITSTSARLARRAKELELSVEAHVAVIRDAERALEALDQGERENKQEVVEAEEKESWFRELEEFIVSIAGFMEAKGGKIDDVERDCIDTFVERTRLMQRARAKRMEDELALFWGVPSTCILPPLPAAMDEEQAAPDAPAALDTPPSQDGDHNSPVRLARCADGVLHKQVDDNALSPPDAAAFEVARKDLSARLSSVLSDVKAPEYLDAAARLPDTRSLHPRSIAARFEDWRQRYGIEYAQAWGGLAIASVWEFYARLEMVLADFLLPSSASSGGGLESFRWHSEVLAYAEHERGEDDADDGPIGGDDEILTTVVQNAVVPKLTTLAERGAYDPWDVRQTTNVLRMVEEASYVLDRSNARFQTLLSAYLNLFKTHISHLDRVLSMAPTLPAPALHPDLPAARQSLTGQVSRTLLRNLVSWSRHLRATPAMQAEVHNTLDVLLGRVVWNLVVPAKGVGGEESAQEVLQSVPAPLWREDTRTRFEAFVRNRR